MVKIQVIHMHIPIKFLTKIIINPFLLNANLSLLLDSCPPLFPITASP